MPECARCSDVGPTIACGDCGRDYCTTHHLPWDHDCPAHDPEVTDDADHHPNAGGDIESVESANEANRDDCTACDRNATVGGLAHRCAYCGRPVCETHRLPENHSCTGELLPPGTSPSATSGGSSVVYDSRSTRASEAISAWSRGRTVDVAPEPTDIPRRALPGSTPERSRARTGSSPDVAPDGSLVQNEDPEAGDDTTTGASGGESLVATAIWWGKVLILHAVVAAVVVLPLLVTGSVSL